MSDIRLKLIQSPTLKCAVRPYFPGSVAGTLPISVSLVGNVYTISWSASAAGFSPWGLTFIAAADAAAAQRLLSLAPRVLTGTGPFTIAADDGPIILNKAAPSATAISLPTVAARNRLPVMISDFAGNAGDITITPASGERIMGLAADAPWTVGSGGAGLGGSVNLYPVSGVGWVINAP